MRLSRLADVLGMSLFLSVFLALSPLSAGQEGDQEEPELPTPKVLRPASADENLQAINDDYNRQLLQLERRRVERMTLLATRQKGSEAAATYEQLFRLAIAGNLFREAEPAANAVIKNGSPSPTASALAHLVKIIAQADRGEYEQSLESLRQAIADRDKTQKAGGSQGALDTTEVLGICEAYFQRLVQGGQFETARKAVTLAREHVQRPAVKDFLNSRLKRLDLVGKPAPPIQGTDIDGKAFNLADYKGKVVLVEFWASWCIPNSAEVEWFHQVDDAYRNRGFQVVTVNLDAAQNGVRKLETVMPNIRRFLLDHNIRWPTLINGKGDHDYAGAYGVTEIPANVLIGRDGTVIHLDLARKNLETVVARAVNP